MPTSRKKASGNRRLSPEERRAQIVETARDLFTERPYEQIGISDVAQAAGVTQSLMYHYFPSKQALFATAMQTSAAELLERSLPDTSMSIPRQFEVGVQGYLDYVLEHRVAYLNLFRGLASAEAEFVTIVEQTRQAIIEHLVITLGLGGYEVPATRLSLRGYIGYVESVILEWLEHQSVPRQALERIIHEVVLGALRAGLSLDSSPLSGKQLMKFEAEYKAHFELP